MVQHGEINPSLYDNLEWRAGVGGGSEVKKEETYVYLWQTCANIWQKPTQYCKAIIQQLKNIEN